MPPWPLWARIGPVISRREHLFEHLQAQQWMAIMEVFLDESGYTGEDLMNPSQPVFVLASTVLSQEVCKEIFDDCFSGLQASELKHSILASRPSGRERVIRFLHAAKQHASAFATAYAHKEFALLTLLIELWVESAMHRDGIDLHNRGGNIGLANLSYITLLSFMPDYREHLNRFQTMMRKRTPRSYERFWSHLYKAHDQAELPLKDILVFFLGSERKLGFQHLVSYPKRSLDLALSFAFMSVCHWHDVLRERFVLVHDQSSNMARQRWLWDAVVNPEVPKTEVGHDRRKVRFSLNVGETQFAPSESRCQLQLVDVLAGATAAFGRSRAQDLKSDYADALHEAGILDFAIGGIWPSTEVEPEELGTVGENAGDIADFIAHLLPSVERS